ncbi:MAG: hypothetical protein ACLRQF_01485 [Thomasclavelia ramosa]
MEILSADSNTKIENIPTGTSRPILILQMLKLNWAQLGIYYTNWIAIINGIAPSVIPAKPNSQVEFYLRSSGVNKSFLNFVANVTQMH